MWCSPLELLLFTLGLAFALAGRVHLTPRRILSGSYARVFGLLLMGSILAGPIVCFAVAIPVGRHKPPGLLGGYPEGILAEIVFDVGYVILVVLIGIILHRYQELAAEQDRRVVWREVSGGGAGDAGQMENNRIESVDERIQP